MTWKSIILSIILPGVVALVVGMLQFYLQAREANLIYSVQQTIPFQGGKETISVQNITFKNNGAKQAENIIAEIRVDDARIKERKTNIDPSLSFDEKIGTDFYRLEARSLNPGERIDLSLLLSSVSPEQKPVKVFLRADGIRGEAAEERKREDFQLPLVATLFTAYLTFAGLLLISPRVRHFIRNIIKNKKLPFLEEQHENIGSLFALYGACEEAEYYIAQRKDCSYWSEADLIAAKAIANPDKKMAILYVQVLCDLVGAVDTMRKSSQAVVHYNIARLYQHLKKDAEAQLSLEIASKLDSNMVNFRKIKDPLFR